MGLICQKPPSVKNLLRDIFIVFKLTRCVISTQPRQKCFFLLFKVTNDDDRDNSGDDVRASLFLAVHLCILGGHNM